MVDYPDIINFTRDELLEEFCKLFDRYQDLKESNEADTQKIHELKRSLDTAVAAQAYLSQELEQYTSNESNQDDNELQKALSELAELRKRYSKLEISYNTLQQDHNALLEENAQLTKNIEELNKRKEQEPAVVESKISEEDLQRIQMLETENMDLLEKMEDFQEQTVRYTLTIAECEVEFNKQTEFLLFGNLLIFCFRKILKFCVTKSIAWRRIYNRKRPILTKRCKYSKVPKSNWPRLMPKLPCYRLLQKTMVEF